MFTRVTVVVSLFCLVLPAATFAQGFVQGDRTLTLSGTGANDDDFRHFIFNVEGKLGYFFADNFQGSFQQGISFVDVPGSDDDWLFASRVALDYVWGSGQWWPFIGVNLGYLWGDRVRDVLTIGPQVGVHYFVNNTTFVLGQVQYEIFTRSGGSGETFGDDRWVYTLGIGFRW
jgi:hypothetical protein